MKWPTQFFVLYFRHKDFHIFFEKLGTTYFSKKTKTMGNPNDDVKFIPDYFLIPSMFIEINIKSSVFTQISKYGTKLYPKS